MDKSKASVGSLKEIIQNIPENKRNLAEKLFKRLKFMDKILNDLEKQIKEEGAVIETTNGNGFDVVVENPAQKSYVAMMAKYNSVVKTLFDVIPDENSQDDELMTFLKR